MAANRRPPEEQALGLCSLCCELVRARDGLWLVAADGEHRTFWHAHCAQHAATELAALATRAMSRGAARPPAPIPAWMTDEANVEA